MASITISPEYNPGTLFTEITGNEKLKGITSDGRPINIGINLVLNKVEDKVDEVVNESLNEKIDLEFSTIIDEKVGDLIDDKLGDEIEKNLSDVNSALDEIHLQLNGSKTYVDPDIIKDKCYINKDSKKWMDLTNVAGSWNFATAIYPIEEGVEYLITCNKVRSIGVWFLDTREPNNSTYGVIVDSNIPENAQLTDYSIRGIEHPYMAIIYNYGDEPEVKKVSPPSMSYEITTIKESITDITNILTKEEEDEILSYDIRNYGLFVKSVVDYVVIAENGEQQISVEHTTTNLIPLDRNNGILINCAGYCYIVFYDEYKNFIERKTSYRNIEGIPASDFPTNAKYVAFSYMPSGLGIEHKTPDVFTTQTEQYSFGFCGVFKSSIKKKKNTRPRIDIYTTDNEYVILSKLMNAFLTRDCDVHFEFGEYNFENIYTEMWDLYGLGSNNASKELPLGGNCRYYLNNSTIVGTYPSGITFNNGCKVFGNLGEPSSSFEIYDGTIIANNCGYGIHSEALGRVGFYKHYIKNIKFIQNGGSRPLGCGSGNSTVLEVDSCVFTSDTGGIDIAMHGVASSSYTLPAHTEVIVRNCEIPNGVQCNTLSANETGILIYINNQSNVSPVLMDGWKLQEQDSADKGRQLALRSLFLAEDVLYNDTDAIIKRTAPWGTEEKWQQEDDGTYTYWEEEAIVDHLPGHYYLNGIGDITEDEMIKIYNTGYCNEKEAAPLGYQNTERTNLGRIGMFNVTFSDSYLSVANNKLEIMNISCRKNRDGGLMGYGQHAFNNSKKLRKIIYLRFHVETARPTAFVGCSNFEECWVSAYNHVFKVNHSFADCPNIYKRFILAGIKKASPTTAITITLHPDAYIRIANQPDILDALKEKNGYTDESGNEVPGTLPAGASINLVSA